MNPQNFDNFDIPDYKEPRFPIKDPVDLYALEASKPIFHGCDCEDCKNKKVNL